MYEMLIEFFIARPGRLSALGRALFQASAMVLIIGLCGRVATTVTSTIPTMAGTAPYAPSLAMLYPTLPTWWIPESLSGYLTYLLSAALGLVLLQIGRNLDRALR